MVQQFQQNQIQSKIIRAIIKFICAGCLLYIACILWWGKQEIMAIFSALGIFALFSGILLSFSSYLFRFLRWHIIFQQFGYHIQLKNNLFIYLSGLALTSTPGKLGETFRSVLLLPHRIQLSHSLAAFLVDRSTDVLGMCLLGGCVAWIVQQENAWLWLLGFFTLCLISLILAAILPRLSSLKRQFTFLNIGKDVLLNWASCWKLHRILIFSILAFISYGIQAYIFAWFCQLSHVEISVARSMLIFVQATLIGAASMIPAGLGTMEAALIFQLIEQGVDESIAASLAIAIRVVTLWFGILVGSCSLIICARKKSLDSLNNNYV